MTEDELVKVDLQLIASDSVVGSDEPLLKIPDGAIGERHDRLGPLPEIRTEWLHPWDVLIACLLQARKLLKTVRIDCRATRDILLDELQQGGRLEIRDNGHACTPRSVSALLNGNCHQNCFTSLQLPTTAQSRLRTSYPRFINFDLTVQGFTYDVDHGPPEFV